MRLFTIKVILLVVLLNTQNVILAQRQETKFGKISTSDFSVISPVVDSGSAAIVLSDIASSDFEGNNNGDFTLVYKRHKRVLIRTRAAFDAATVSIQLYSGGNSISTERLSDLKASTFFIMDGKVVEKELGKDGVLTEKVNNEVSLRKFTFPDVKEDCIIEYEYVIKSPFYTRLKSWQFQDNYPVLWSQYTVTIPFIFDYLISKFGYHPFTINENSKKYKTYTLRLPTTNAGYTSDVFTLSGDAVTSTWAIKDLPAFKSEAFISTPSNHISRIHFQLRSIKYSETSISYAVKDWFSTADDLMKDPDFSKEIYEGANWIKEELKQITKSSDAEIQKAKSVFEFIRDKFICTDYDAKWLSQPLKKTFQSKTGNVADINMLLTAMLKSAGYQAVPVLLSTRDNGVVNEEVALLTQYNYVISQVKIGDQYYLLDASRNKIGFGDLPPDCFNGSARIIDRIPSLIPLTADSAKNTDITSIQLTNAESGKMKGNYYSLSGKFESLSLRNKFSDKKKDEILKTLTEGYPQSFTFQDLSIDSLALYEFPLAINYGIKATISEDEDIIYFNPMLKEGYSKNPFVSAERLYPVEMPYCINETYVLTMEIPKGYRIEELPKSAKVNFNDNEGGFEYIIAKQGEFIMLRSKLFFNKAIFLPEDYEVLRNFFGFIVKKHAEQIVFKKN